MRGRTVAALLAMSGAAGVFAADGEVHVYSDIRPGVYGRIDLRGAPPPPLVYERPVIVVQPPPARPRPEPLYLHVPPGHAKNWKKHCRKYDACGRPVYFVVSDEYKPKKAKKPKKEKG